ncbi:chloride channel [Aureococcus anophagefferens]|nr:chloride channel [Aureococcus anophagefferens]
MWTWKKVAQATSGRVADLAHGPSCAQSRLRLFGASEKDVRVTLFRDHHAWCPYCQKIWLWLEEKRVPYRVKKAAARDLVDARAGGVPAETTVPVPDDAKLVAAARVAQFRSQIAAVNGELADAAAVDGALLAAVANLLDGGTAAAPPPGTAAALRYVKDRVNVPRDMPIHSARALCAALEATAALDSAAVPRSKIRLKDRRDQDPRPFQSAGVRVTA